MAFWNKKSPVRQNNPAPAKNDHDEFVRKYRMDYHEGWTKYSRMLPQFEAMCNEMAEQMFKNHRTNYSFSDPLTELGCYGIDILAKYGYNLPDNGAYVQALRNVLCEEVYRKLSKYYSAWRLSKEQIQSGYLPKYVVSVKVGTQL